MRIIGGKYRGKKLISPDNEKVRPTSDRAREALFNILRSRLGDKIGSSRLLDVFAGSGAFGLEALSQGFAAVGMMDIDLRTLEKNARLFPAEKSKLEIFRRDALLPGAASQPFDVLFMDAPYKQGLSEKALRALAADGWLTEGAFCIIEVKKDEEIVLPTLFVKLEERRYGLAKVILAAYRG